MRNPLQATCQPMRRWRASCVQVANRTPSMTAITREHGMLYKSFQTRSDGMWALRALATAAIPVLDRTRPGLSGDKMLRKMAAALEVFLLAALTHRRPPFRIDTVKVGEVDVAVHERSEEHTS